MAINSNITDLFEGEALVILVSITNSNKTPVTNTGDFSLELRVSETPYNDPLLTFSEDPYITLVDVSNAMWKIKIPSAALEDLLTSKIYYYNIWSTEVGEDPVLQVRGQITINDAIN
jgi:hypothetical protein